MALARSAVPNASSAALIVSAGQEIAAIAQ
jgi:hypothetical protein